jgi:hypothetical protein
MRFVASKSTTLLLSCACGVRTQLHLIFSVDSHAFVFQRSTGNLKESVSILGDADDIVIIVQGVLCGEMEVWRLRAEEGHHSAGTMCIQYERLW